MADFARIAVLENEVEAGLLGALLDDAGISHMIQSYYDSAYDGVFQAQKGWGCVRAEEADREAVEAVLEDVRSGKHSV